MEKVNRENGVKAPDWDVTSPKNQEKGFLLFY